MKVWRGAEILLHSFVASTHDGGEWTTPRTGRFNPEANLIRSRVGGLSYARRKTLVPTGIRATFRLAHSLVGLTP